MGFFGSMGKALMAPIRATNSIAGKAPGAQGIMGAANKLPGMQTANKLNPMMQGFMKQKPGGIGPTQPPVGLGGPTPPSMGSPTPMPNVPSGNQNDGINPGNVTTMPMKPQPSIFMGNGGGMGPSQNVWQNMLQGGGGMRSGGGGMGFAARNQGTPMMNGQPVQFDTTSPKALQMQQMMKNLPPMVEGRDYWT